MARGFAPRHFFGPICYDIVTIIWRLCAVRLGAIFEGWRESVAMAGECGAGRERRVFLEEVFEECEWWFSR